MMGWVARAAAQTAERVQEPRNRFARWTARWRPPSTAVPAARFQDDDEPYPGHWRELPTPWPSTDPAAAATQALLSEALATLPTTWRAVVIARDTLGRSPDQVSAELDLTEPEQTAILNQARAALRERMAQQLTGEDDR
ncbi:sigma-70 family RNA polymerase sigma factor [Antrihabitans cavernicola]|uniref:Sigma-70 family RNA polymerase sigma factor n=1 Tax=Antrihabitans cavernicola TaxID=2495913 RepID=A0A5A7SAD3_9NOCA|nr:sigma-70 family RNA polymerase sigma factor [Spelaeibacter cavernicola]KAA0022142.1 sigma-70 family RNA polymerase sigma factor [Spelaeibacter cavernicola]